MTLIGNLAQFRDREALVGHKHSVELYLRSSRLFPCFLFYLFSFGVTVLFHRTARRCALTAVFLLLRGNDLDDRNIRIVVTKLRYVPEFAAIAASFWKRRRAVVHLTCSGGQWKIAL